MEESKHTLKDSEIDRFLERYELEHFHHDVFERVVTLIIAALGLIAALAWDDALKHLFETIFGGKGTLDEELSYALVITIIAALISVQLGRMFVKRKRNNK
jgi:hypothetical protein